MVEPHNPKKRKVHDISSQAKSSRDLPYRSKGSDRSSKKESYQKEVKEIHPTGANGHKRARTTEIQNDDHIRKEASRDDDVADSEDEDADSEDEDADSEDEEDDGEASAKGSTSSSSSISDTEDDAPTKDMDEEVAKLNAALAEIVGTVPFDGKKTMPKGPATDDEASDESDDDDDEEMSDDQMFALDERMAEVFRQRQVNKSPQQQRRQETKDARGNMVQFKNRVLDFLEVYVKHEHVNPLCLTILLPLLKLIRTTRQKQLSERAAGLIRTLTQKCKGRDVPGLLVHYTGGSDEGSSDGDDVDEEAEEAEEAEEEEEGRKKDDDVVPTMNLLQLIHNEAGSAGASRLHGTACSQASLLIVKTILYDGHYHRHGQGQLQCQQRLEGIVKMYGQSQIRWMMDRKDFMVQPTFFLDFVHWGQSFGHQLSLRPPRHGE